MPLIITMNTIKPLGIQPNKRIKYHVYISMISLFIDLLDVGGAYDYVSVGNIKYCCIIMMIL